MRPSPLPRRWPRPALVLRRHPRARQAAAVLAALAVGLAVQRSEAGADRARARWGESVAVVVAVRDLGPGDELAGAVDVERWPAALAPAHGLASVEPGQRVTAAIFAGEPVDERRLAPAGLTPLAARIPEGLRGVAIPVEPGTAPPLRPGDEVDVVVALPGEQGDGAPGFTLVRRALVVEVSDGAVTVAVTADDAPRIAVALASGAVTLAALGPP